LDARQDNNHQRAECHDSRGHFTTITQPGVDLLEYRQQGDSDNGSPDDWRNKGSENLKAPAEKHGQDAEPDSNVDCLLG
jgi:hypothetical protein